MLQVNLYIKFSCSLFFTCSYIYMSYTYSHVVTSKLPWNSSILSCNTIKQRKSYCVLGKLKVTLGRCRRTITYCGHDGQWRRSLFVDGPARQACITYILYIKTINIYIFFCITRIATGRQCLRKGVVSTGPQGPILFLISQTHIYQLKYFYSSI